MPEIKCPNCGALFQVDKSDYEKIVLQVRDKELEKEVSKRENDVKAFYKRELENIALKNSQQQDIIKLKQDALLQEKKEEINALKAQIANFKTELSYAVQAEKEKQNEKLYKQENEIVRLQEQIKRKEVESKAQVNDVTNRYEEKLKAQDELIAYYKDFKMKQSTKMIGESLEQFCLNEFNKIRMSAFPYAYFEKDNDIKTGSKGDFIFREKSHDGQGEEFISIMFEMKNEADDTQSKHKNADFFKELDKDRREKHCEYAVLVSMLEGDSDYYNQGIVDVSYIYPKMYVIRPHLFIPMITLLRNAALNSIQYQEQLIQIQNQQLDLKNFEDNMKQFKEAFGKNYRLASDRFTLAIEEIDKTIIHLQKTKDALLSSINNLRLANVKAEDLSIKKLTKNAQSVKEMFDKLSE